MLMQGITYNTTMALVAGAIMVLVVLFARVAANPNHRTLAGWGWTFVATGAFLGITGIHMTLTWPLAQIDGAFCCSVDNITFGEPAAFYGILTFIAGIAILRAEKLADKGVRPLDLVATLRPLLYVAAIGGFGLVLFGIAGMHFGMWRPPEIEPVARLMAGSLIEPLLVMFLYVGTGVSAILSPFVPDNKWVARIAAILTWGVGMLWIFLSFTVFYSHVGFFPQPDGSYI
ncbi:MULTISPECIES: DUF981 family protein [Actinomycetaceae]|uniref:DUF981 family protein n=1 Tax=Schaalia turicensis TaxID=131111 RepID=A0ABZ0RL65_9ACTO|nr:DUF981 family protein [Actinotignum sanguinis]WPJ89666.1 DUF981 family protein [Schaalia turicensis]MDK8512747.1 DUF981 family protein [Actinotignum sanguinis]MDK8519057.1 DUF981 family protein [Actinotignum sanguinis]MDK8748398.1 DUF981 family protein [Actinotignum sanguinis]MDV2437336.1 DUF981 family protein [Actinotignum sanguinis]